MRLCSSLYSMNMYAVIGRFAGAMWRCCCLRGCDVIMDYCKSVKLLLSLSVHFLVWRTATVSQLDVDIGEMRHHRCFVTLCRGCKREPKMRVPSKAQTMQKLTMSSYRVGNLLTPSSPVVSDGYTSKCSGPYCSNPLFNFFFDIWALWRSGLSARVPKCQKIKSVGYTSMALNALADSFCQNQ